ncbi:MAG: hypothetical protein DRG27_01025 [Deltaproteobacteria bacterium]|nr:MAG: hypothetical protein DRG27_01025 [Deltaproteobacteria bacterium]
MVVKIKAKSAESAPRMLIVNQKPIYNVDRQDGFRLTVFDRDTMKIMADANFDTFSEAYSTFMKYYNIPGYIAVINGHGKGNVVVAIIDANTQNKLIKKGDKEAYAEYIVSISAPEEVIKNIKEEQIAKSPSVIVQKQEKKADIKTLLTIAAAIFVILTLLGVIKHD